MPRRRKSLEDRLQRDYERGDLKSVRPTPAERTRLQAAARATLAKDRRINVRLSSTILDSLQANAAEEGIPYQTLISSVLHKYVSGRLVEAPSRVLGRTVGAARRARPVE